MRTSFLAFIVASVLCSSTLADPLEKSLSEDFDANSLPASLDESGGSPNYSNGGVIFRGWERRTYLRTKANFNDTSFVARISVRISQGHGGAGGAFIGFGAGFADCAYYGEPRIAPDIYARLFAFDFESGAMSVTNSNIENLGRVFHMAGDGNHRVQLVWNHQSRQFTVSIHQNYVGGPFVSSGTLGPFTATDVFGPHNSRLFFGGSGVYDDFVLGAIERRGHGETCSNHAIRKTRKGLSPDEATSFREAVLQLCQETD